MSSQFRVEIRKIDDIKPYEKNPRRNDKAVEAVARSIREFGFRQPIVIDSNGVIVVGHTRWKAAKALGLEKVPVHVATDMTPKQIKAYRIADNKIAELADWDHDLLPAELSELQGMNIDLDLLGFSSEELEKILGTGVYGNEGMTDPDAVPEPPDKPTTQPGDLWILGDHRLLCGDSSKTEDVDRLLGGAAIDLVNTDPPYNVKLEPRSSAAIAASQAGRPGLTGKNAIHSFDIARGKAGRRDRPKKMRPKDRSLQGDFLSDKNFDDLLRAWFAQIARVLKPGHCWYVWGGYSNCFNYPPAIKACGLHFSQSIIWVKEFPVLRRKDFLHNHEWCFYGWKPGKKGVGKHFGREQGHVFYGSPNIADTWQLSRADHGQVSIGRGVNLVFKNGARIGICPPQNEWREVQVSDDAVTCHGDIEPIDVWTVKKIPPQSMVHLTEKPVELATRAIVYSSRPGENVLDLFGGSGSTLIACEQTGRRAFLMEIDALYCDVIVRRWEEFTGKKAKRKR